MHEYDFEILESFIKLNQDKFIDFPINSNHRKLGMMDYVLRYLYFLRCRK